MIRILDIRLVFSGKCHRVRASYYLFAAFLCGLMAPATLSAQGMGNSSVEWKIIHAGMALLVPGQPPERAVSIVVRDNLVTRVESGYVDADSIGLNDSDVQRLDLRDQFVLPGLMDAHVHLTTSHREPGIRFDIARLLGRLQSSEEATVQAVANAHKTLLAGFTTVRDVGASSARAAFAVRDAIAAGRVPGPRVYAAGTPLSPTGGHGDSPGEALSSSQSPGVCDGVDDCLRETRRQIREGANFIKVHATGGGSEESGGREAGPSFRQEELEAIVEAAHNLGRSVAAHAHGYRGINAALKAGVDSVEHGDGSDAESLELFLGAGAFLVPTLSVLNDLQSRIDESAVFGELTYRARYEAVMVEMPRKIAELHRNGVKIAAGSDAPLNPHGRNADELEWYVRIGISPMEAITSATLNTARLIGIERNAGSIEAGKWADIIAVDRNPLEEIDALKSVTFVMKDGKVYLSTSEKAEQ